MISRPPAEEYDGAAVRAVLEREAPMQLAPPRRPPTYANTTLVADLGGYKLMLFRLARYRVDPLPYARGAVLLAMRNRLLQLTVDLASSEVSDKQALRERKRIMDACVKEFYRCARPVGRLHRLLYPILPNPFALASEDDVFRLLGFFLACRTTFSVHPLETPARRSPIRTPRTI